MPSEVAVDTPYYVCLTVLLLLCWLLSWFPLSHTLWQLFSSRSRAPPSLTTKCTVLPCLLGLMGHLTGHALFRILQHVPQPQGTSGTASSRPFVTRASCRAYVVFVNVAFYAGKAGLYAFFVFRAQHTFEETTMRYSPRMIRLLIWSLILFNALFCAWFVLPSMPLIYVARTTHGGRICVYSAADDVDGNRGGKMQFYNDMVNASTIATGIVDAIWGALTVWLLVGRFFQLAHQSARSRGESRFRFTSSEYEAEEQGEEARAKGKGKGKGEVEMPERRRVTFDDERGGDDGEEEEEEEDFDDESLGHSITSTAGRIGDDLVAPPDSETLGPEEAPDGRPIQYLVTVTPHLGPVASGSSEIHDITPMSSFRQGSPPLKAVDETPPGNTSPAEAVEEVVSDDEGGIGEVRLMHLVRSMSSEEDNGGADVGLQAVPTDTLDTPPTGDQTAHTLQTTATGQHSPPLRAAGFLHQKRHTDTLSVRGRAFSLEEPATEQGEEGELTRQMTVEYSRTEYYNRHVPRLSNNITEQYRRNAALRHGLSAERKLDVLLFHEFTKDDNDILFLSLKLLVLVTFGSLTSVAAFLIWIYVSGNGYMFDSAANITCLWLTFRFAQKYYYRFFCGRQWRRWLFPLLKTCALTCCTCVYDLGAELDLVDNEAIQSGGMCCLCSSHTRTEQWRVYRLAVAEYFVILEAKGNVRRTVLNHLAEGGQMNRKEISAITKSASRQ